MAQDTQTDLNRTGTAGPGDNVIGRQVLAWLEERAEALSEPEDFPEVIILFKKICAGETLEPAPAPEGEKEIPEIFYELPRLQALFEGKKSSEGVRGTALMASLLGVPELFSSYKEVTLVVRDLLHKHVYVRYAANSLILQKHSFQIEMLA